MPLLFFNLLSDCYFAVVLRADFGTMVWPLWACSYAFS